MSKQEFVSIHIIDPNPYQHKEFVDAAKVQEIQESLKQNLDAGIGTNGLLQVPTARKVDGRYQLAFGHHRHLAFVYLAAEGNHAFEQMPLIVEDFTNQQMFEAMASENLQRRDISFVEEGEVYHTYMTTFGKTSVECGQRFGKTEEHVRGRLMFVQLPEAAKEKAKRGEVNVTIARDLVSARKLIGDAGVTEIVRRMEEEDFTDIYDNPKEAIEDYMLRDAPNLQRMEYKLAWLDLAGKKFPSKHLTPVAKKVVAEILDVQTGDVACKQMLQDLMELIGGGMEIVDQQFEAFDAEQLEKVRVLINPPACTACPFHAIFDGNHYCGLKLCYERKEHAWRQADVEKVWKELGIPLYVNEATDGRAVELSRWQAADQKLFTERNADLRLKPTTRSVYNNFDGLPSNVILVAVGKTAEKRLKANGKAVEKAQTELMNRDLQFKLRDLKGEHVMRFHWNVAVPAFEGLLDSMSNLPFTLFLYEDAMLESVDFIPGMDGRDEQSQQIRKAKKKADAFKQLRRLMIAEVLDRAIGWQSYNAFGGAKKPMMEFAKRAQKRAEEWNWKLPKDFVKQAETYQAELDKAIKELTAKQK